MCWLSLQAGRLIEGSQQIDCVESVHIDELDAIDDEINGDFWRERFPSNSHAISHEFSGPFLQSCGLPR